MAANQGQEEEPGKKLRAETLGEAMARFAPGWEDGFSVSLPCLPFVLPPQAVLPAGHASCGTVDPMVKYPTEEALTGFHSGFRTIEAFR